MHPRNKHREYLDYSDLACRQKGLKRFVFENAWGGASIDYSNQEALEELTRSLLAEFYDIRKWTLPKGYLCPPVPQRADYVHTIADLLNASLSIVAGDDQQALEAIGPRIWGLDIGAGASCIYSLLGVREYGWSFIASDVDEVALRNAEDVLSANSLSSRITLRRQADPKQILKGVLRRGESLAFTICNPPFHETLDHAEQAATMKWKRLSRGKQLSNKKNYQGQEVELCCEGGEVGFVLRLVEESARQRFRLACLWFSSLLSRQSSMKPIHQRLGELGAKRRRFEICQGRNVKWVIAWSFYPKTERGLQLLQMLEVARGDASEANEAREGTEETEAAVPEMPVPRKRSAQPVGEAVRAKRPTLHERQKDMFQSCAE
ncbi:rlmF [Symbiodinium sp. CCMP2592]|nr:rlmF [Symbiodinium sp. CCMP2592]